MDDREEFVILDESRSPYLTRTEAAAYIKEKPKRMAHLPIPRIVIGRRIKYDVADLDRYMASLKKLPINLAIPVRSRALKRPRRSKSNQSFRDEMRTW